MKFLAGIAMGMRREAARGIARHRLRRGLALTLRRDNGDWVLSLSRQDVPPSEKEEEVCRRAFGVGDQVERHTADIDNGISCGCELRAEASGGRGAGLAEWGCAHRVDLAGPVGLATARVDFGAGSDADFSAVLCE